MKARSTRRTENGKETEASQADETKAGLLNVLNDAGMAWLATELACEVNRQNCEKQMSINTLRESLKHIPGGKNLTMRYGKGGRTQIFTIGEEEVEVGPDATAFDIEAALEAKKKEQSSAIQ